MKNLGIYSPENFLISFKRLLLTKISRGYCSMFSTDLVILHVICVSHPIFLELRYVSGILENINWNPFF